MEGKNNAIAVMRRITQLRNVTILVKKQIDKTLEHKQFFSYSVVFQV